MKLGGLVRQFFYFFIAGFTAVFTDYIIYIITSNFIGLFFSKLIGFYSGVIVSYLINGSYTFKKNGKSLLSSRYFKKYIIALTISMTINVSLNYLTYKLFFPLNNVRFFAFAIATLSSMIFNFISLKFYVFK